MGRHESTSQPQRVPPKNKVSPPRSELVEVERKFGSAFLARNGVSARRNAGRCHFGAHSRGFEDIAKATLFMQVVKTLCFFCVLLSRDVQKPLKDLSTALAAYRRRYHVFALVWGGGKVGTSERKQQ